MPTEVSKEMYLDRVQKLHACNKCGRMLAVQSIRVRFVGYRYCIVCGYRLAKEKKEFYTEFVKMMEDKYSKKMVEWRLE